MYPQYLQLQESGHNLDYRIIKAFDFDFSEHSYWISNSKLGYFSICFPKHTITIESFEITTSGGNCRPIQFAAEVSVDGINYQGLQSFEYEMKMNESKQFVFNENNIYIRCFKFYTIVSTCPDLVYGSDINQVEFFGNLIETNQRIIGFNPPKVSCLTYSLYYRRFFVLFPIFLWI